MKQDDLPHADHFFFLLFGFVLFSICMNYESLDYAQQLKMQRRIAAVHHL